MLIKIGHLYDRFHNKFQLFNGKVYTTELRARIYVKSTDVNVIFAVRVKPFSISTKISYISKIEVGMHFYNKIKSMYSKNKQHEICKQLTFISCTGVRQKEI